MAVPGGVSTGLPVLVPTMVATVLSRGQSLSGTMARGGLTSDPTESVSVVSAIVDSDACGGDAMVVLFLMGSSGDVSRCVLARDSLKNMGAVRSDARALIQKKLPFLKKQEKWDL